MLKNLYNYFDEVNKIWSEICEEDRFDDLSYSAYTNFRLFNENANDNWNDIRKVSIHPKTGEIIGVFDCNLDRVVMIANRLLIANLSDKYYSIFIKDLLSFIEHLIELGAKKLEYTIVSKNTKSLKLGKKFCELLDGTFYERPYYFKSRASKNSAEDCFVFDVFLTPNTICVLNQYLSKSFRL